MLRNSLFILFLLSTPITFAEENLAPPPPLPEELNNQIPEPEVTIVHSKGATIEEYRVNGLLDTRNDNLENPPINQWILMSW